MQIHPLHRWQHEHRFNLDAREGERRATLVVILTALMMVVEVAAGFITGSMALLADGWHMGTHVAALGISVFAYRYAREHENNPQYSFGTGKVGALGGFASAVALAVVALMMGIESVGRLISPERIQFDEALLVAVIGLVVNLVSARMLHGDAGHQHDTHPGDPRPEADEVQDERHPDHHDHDHHHHHDHNLRAAYLHVLADALTSVLAIIALVGGKLGGWLWMDALMGLVGAALITRWGYGLVLETSGILLDSIPSDAVLRQIREAIESDQDNQVADLHLWRLGPRDFGAIVSVVTHHPRDVQHYKDLLSQVEHLGHLTVEVNRCSEPACLAPATRT